MPAASGDNPPRTHTSGYSLRGNRYTYSHGKAPEPKDPLLGAKRPAVPASAAVQKRQRKSNTSNRSQDAPETGNSQPTSTESDNLQVQLDEGASAANPDTQPQGSTCTPVRPGNPRGSQNYAISEEQTADPQQPHDSPTQPSGQAQTGLTGYVQQTPRRPPDIEVVQPTPERFASRPTGTQDGNLPITFTMGVTTPALPFAICEPPNWAMNFEDSHLLDPFVPQPNFQINFSLGTQLPNPDSDLQFFATPQSPTYGRRSSSDNRELTTQAGLTLDPFAAPVEQPAPTVTRETPSAVSEAPTQQTQTPSPPRATTPNFNNCLPVPNSSNLEQHGTTRGTVPSLNVECTRASQATVSQPQSPSLAELHSTIAHSLLREVTPWARGPPPTFSARSQLPVLSQSRPPAPPSRGPPPAPTSLTVPAPPARGSSPTPLPRAASITDTSDKQLKPSAQRNLRQGSFSPIQKEFIKLMTRRWHWYLLTENAFPINPNEALERCVVYAEQDLHASRDTYQFDLGVRNYVRGKDSRIRNDLLRGVLIMVEDLYGVSCETTDMIARLVKGSNFICAEHDPETGKVSGRYRHPCIGQVIKLMVFPQISRGISVGAHFIHELLAYTPVEVTQGYADKTANYGAPVPTIALACTMILHCLHLLERGYSSRQVAEKGKKKVISLEEGAYGAHYRKYLAWLKSYARLSEVRQAHMQTLLKEYRNQFPDNQEITVEDEYNGMHSDGD
ncbi:hypothetical protein FRC10_003185 [Ceratobasidium sp. 414]|nr:hypothetical protein FRC10_003185 [Ceratobasidium sp. 414]